MFDEELETICKKLAPIEEVGEKKAQSLLLNYRISRNPIAKLKAERLIHLFKNKFIPNDDKYILLPPPSIEEARGEFHLGTINYGEKELYSLYLTREDLNKHVSLFGITGSGKTYLALNLILELLEKDVPFIVIDWKRSYYRDLSSLNLSKFNSIQRYTVGRKSPSPFNWNPLKNPQGVHPKTWISVIAETLEKSHLSGPGVANVFTEIFDEAFQKLGVYDNNYTKYPNFFDAKEILERKKFRGRKSLWQDSCQRILTSFCFGPSSGAFNSRNPINLEEILDKPCIIELDQELPKPLRVFFSEVILRWLHLYMLEKGEANELRNVLLLEEMHNLFPKTLIEKQSTNILENIFREIRSFGVGLIGITQHPSLIPTYVLGNTNTQIYLALQHRDDIDIARKALFLEKGDEVFLDRLKVGEGIVKIKSRISSCHVKFPNLPVKKRAIQDSEIDNGGSENPEENLD